MRLSTCSIVRLPSLIPTLAWLTLAAALAAGCTAASSSPARSAATTPAAPSAPAPAAPAAVSPTAAGQTAAPPSDRPTAIEQVYIKDMKFSPATMTVQVGTVVLWSNLDGTDHTVTGPGWELGPFGNGQAWAHTFNKVGTEEIHCRLHPEMKMTVTVTDLKR